MRKSEGRSRFAAGAKKKILPLRSRYPSFNILCTPPCIINLLYICTCFDNFIADSVCSTRIYLINDWADSQALYCPSCQSEIGFQTHCLIYIVPSHNKLTSRLYNGQPVQQLSWLVGSADSLDHLQIQQLFSESCVLFCSI